MAKDAYYFSHDANARRDPKILAMRSAYGAQGYGWYWMIIESMREETDYTIKKSKYMWGALAAELGGQPEEVERFVSSCINDFELFEEDDECIWSDSLLRRMEVKDAKQRARSKRARKAAKARWQDANSNDEESQAEQSQCSSKADAEECSANNMHEQCTSNIVDYANAMHVHKGGNAKNEHSNAIIKESKRKESKGEEKGSTPADLTSSESKYISIIKRVDNYPLDIDTDVEYFHTLQERYPDTDILACVQEWSDYKLDHPLKNKSSPRSQIGNWCKKDAEEFHKHTKKQRHRQLLM